jgi:hypothetical protein
MRQHSRQRFLNVLSSSGDLVCDRRIRMGLPSFEHVDCGHDVYGMKSGVQHLRKTRRRCYGGHRRAGDLDCRNHRTHAGEIVRGRKRRSPRIRNDEDRRIGVLEYAFRRRSKQRVGRTRHAMHAEHDQINLLALRDIADDAGRFTGDDVLTQCRVSYRRGVRREAGEFLARFVRQVDALGSRCRRQQRVLDVQDVQRGSALSRQSCREFEGNT